MRLVAACLSLAALAGPASGVASEQGTTPAAEGGARPLQHTRPVGADGTTQVEIGFYVVDVLYIHDADETFEADFMYTLSWEDPRLVAEADLGGSVVSLEDIWSPSHTITNQRQVSRFFDEVASVDEQGRVYYRQRVLGQFTADLDLREFPFDEQDLLVQMVVLGDEAEHIQLVEDPRLRGSRENISPAGWSVEFVGPELRRETVESQDRSFPRVDHQLRAARLPQYYRLKVFLPLMLIVFMAWTVFWLDPKESGPQVGVATASVFTLIAFSLSLSTTLPRIAYATRADEFVLGSTLLVFFALGEAILTTTLAKQGRHRLALRLDRWARVAYPILFVIMAAITIFPKG